MTAGERDGALAGEGRKRGRPALLAEASAAYAGIVAIGSRGGRGLGAWIVAATGVVLAREVRRTTDRDERLLFAGASVAIGAAGAAPGHALADAVALAGAGLATF